MPVYICLLEVRIALPHAESLKEKRRVVKSLAAQVRRRFGAAVSEIADHDVRSSAVVLCALVGAADTPARADEVERFVEARCVDGCLFVRNLVTLEDIRA